MPWRKAYGARVDVAILAFTSPARRSRRLSHPWRHRGAVLRVVQTGRGNIIRKVLTEATMRTESLELISGVVALRDDLAALHAEMHQGLSKVEARLTTLEADVLDLVKSYAAARSSRSGPGRGTQ
jgi:hypothetical protein